LSLHDDLATIDPENIDALSALLQKHVGEGDADASGDGDDKGDASDTKGESAAGDKPDDKGSATPDAATDDKTKEPDGVLLKDGKTVAPFAILKGERSARQQAEQRAAQAEAQAKELSEALERMKAEASTRQAGDKPSEQAKDDANLYSPEELANLRENFPELAKMADAYAKQVEVINDLKAKVAQPPAAKAGANADTKPAPTDTDDQADAAQVKLQEAINANPLLAKWQSKGGRAWGAAVEVDAELREDPAWQDKPLAERLAEVERRVADDFGIERTTPKTPGAAGAKTAPPKVRQTEIETLSDLSGRAPNAEADATSGMSASEMRSLFEGWSDEQIARHLARIGGA